MRNRSKHKEVVTAEYVLTFGKYKGKSLGWVLSNEPGYIIWLVDNDALAVADDVVDEAKKYISEVGEGRDCMDWNLFND